jgi:hypothetical protein
MTVWTVLRSTAKIFSPTVIKAAFWTAVVYLGPATTVATLGPVPFAATLIFMHFGGPELLSLTM